MALKQSAIALLLFALAGCASVEVQKPATPSAAYSGGFLEAQALARGHDALAGQARKDNAARIESLLARLDDATLARDAARLPAGDPLYTFAGRALLNRGLPLPRAFDRGDASYGAANRPAADRDGYRPPLRVGVLLPLSGGQSAAAGAVRDGYLAGYYGERRRRPELHFYDTAGGAGGAYARAAAEGNDFVVGPLGRDEVDALFAQPARVPTLALNRGSHAPPDGSAGFSLSPEDEGISLARYLVERGARRVLVQSGGEDAQRRAAGAAKEQLERRGVQVTTTLDGAQGVDALVLAMKAPEARALLPRLASSGIAPAIRVATSQITSGTGKPAEDAVLDGIVHPTETWLVRNVAGLPAQSSAAALTDSARGPAARLFAFGHDAWLLTAYLEHLATTPNASIAGATGNLGLDGFGNVLRVPAWSRFSGGVALPLADGAR